MAINTGNGSRKGIILNRSQTFNPKTGQYVKRDETGKFVSSKETPFKNIRRENAAKKQENIEKIKPKSK